MDADAPHLCFRRATGEDLEKVFRLRYQVYVIERKFERPEDHPEGLEHDRFDSVAAHILCEHRDGSVVGTIRLIPPSALGYPLEEYCTLSIDPSRLPRQRLGEVSRLAISREFQRRQDDPFNPAHPPLAGVAGLPQPASHDRRRNHLVLGLYRELYRLSKEMRLTHWYAAMEDKLWILLRRLGFDFQQIGPYVDYHGRRAPFLSELSVLEQMVRERAPDLYRYFTEGS